VKKGADWRSGEGARMISAIMRKRITAFFLLLLCRFAKRVIKDVITLKSSGRGTLAFTRGNIRRMAESDGGR
jgi:hypothetical protein